MTSLHPFADYLKLTVPVGESFFLQETLKAIVIEAGGHEAAPGLFRLGEGGTVKFRDFGKVGSVGVSGAALAALRGAGLFLSFLSAVSECPHRVTQIDIAVDVQVDAGPIVRRLYRKAVAGDLQLSRKSLATKHVKRIARVGFADGRETGTVYLGSRTSAVCARVYDKRNEVLDKAVKSHGSHPDVLRLNDPGPLTRYEVTCGRKVGVTLRDVVEPAALFWHYAAGLLPVPKGIPRWEPHAEGYELPRHEPDPVRQLRLLLEVSPDVRRVLRLVHAIGGPEPQEGLKRLRSALLQKRLAA